VARSAESNSAAATRVLAVVPARGGSKGFPRKNVAPLLGLPLVGHALRFTALVPEIDKTIVSTDDDEIARAARAYGGDVPFVRPADLAEDGTAMWPVLRHALEQVDPGGDRFAFLLLVDPTSPVRNPADVTAMLARLRADAAADGIVSVAEPSFSIVWQAVVERDGYLAHLVEPGARLVRRQDAPAVHVIDGSLYLWRASFVRAEHETWFNGRLLVHVVDSAGSIDTPRDLARVEALVRAGLFRLPWLENGAA
jgi:N-acylneuraminate cytidylyltransferase